MKTQQGKTQRSLTQVLARQWALYTLALFSGFFVVCAFLLYILEDSFINRRLQEAAKSMTSLDYSANTLMLLPQQLVRYAEHDVPPEIAHTLFETKAYGIKEFRVTDGRYVHAMKFPTENGDWRYLVYDVTDEMRVNINLYRGLPYVLIGGILLAFGAYLLAHRFASKTGRQAQALLTALGTLTDAESIRALSRAQSIFEFAQLAMINADAVEQQQETLKRERQTLEFMAHELRTPLQSLRTNLALLHQNKANDQAWMRLQRACTRLVRASYSVLWLSEQADPQTNTKSDVHPILMELSSEFAPLMALRKQTLVLNEMPEQFDSSTNTTAPFESIQWEMPSEILETVLANVLLNAIQHGQPGQINVRSGINTLTIENPVLPSAQNVSINDNQAGNFGMGLEITRRLLHRLGWNVSHQHKNDVYCVKITKHQNE